METIASWIGWFFLIAIGLVVFGVALRVILGVIIPGRWQCAMGFHRLDDSWCVRKGCNYHQINC